MHFPLKQHLQVVIMAFLLIPLTSFFSSELTRWASLLSLFAGLSLTWRIPSDYYLAYGRWVRQQHGLFVSLSIGVLLAVMAPLVITSITGTQPSVFIDYGVPTIIFLVIAAIAWDQYRFYRSGLLHTFMQDIAAARAADDKADKSK